MARANYSDFLVIVAFWRQNWGEGVCILHKKIAYWGATVMVQVNDKPTAGVHGARGFRRGREGVLRVRAAANSAKFTAGSKLAFNPTLSLFGTVDGEFSDRTRSYSGTGGIKISW
jgi:hypothetical protein